jgi:hypothetical protein
VNNTPGTVTTSNPGLTGFAGLDAVTSEQVNGYTLEPPDQGLCTDGTYVMEAINLVWAVYSTQGNTVAGPQSMNSFFGQDPSLFMSDPRCYYDVATHRWFVTILDTDSSTFSHVDIAVSKTADPSGAYYLYRVDDTSGGQRGGCPCLGDQPLMGADANGFYVSVNEFNMPQLHSYQGTAVYALSKAKLESGTMGTPVLVRPPDSASSPANPRAPSVQPAQSPTGQFQSAGGGTEYLLSIRVSSANAIQHDIVAWALSGTSSLNSASPSLKLSAVRVSSEPYGSAPFLTQKNGPIPQGNSLGFTSPQPLDTLDSRMQQVVYDGSRLWAGLDTDVNGQPGIAWFVVEVSGAGGSLAANMANQGFLTGAGNLGLAFPSFSVNSAGRALMAFAASGPNNFPSVGYVTMTANTSPGPIHLASAGAAPYDGFTCYLTVKQGGPCRWGDYTAATVAPNGSVWFAGETVTPTRDSFGDNWGTFIGNVTP